MEKSYLKKERGGEGGREESCYRSVYFRGSKGYGCVLNIPPTKRERVKFRVKLPSRKY